MEPLAPPRGTVDLFPPLSEHLQQLARTAQDLARSYGYRAVETPAFEHTELFKRTSGEASDIVTKEMYTFDDQGGRSMTLRPEGTAAIVRAYLPQAQELPLPFKAYYVEPFWRHGRPQAGRLREFRQFGVEVIGSAAPGADVEVIVIAEQFLRERGLVETTLHLNSVGDEQCRPAYREQLTTFLEGNEDQLCTDCRARMHTNPMRTFDCKEADCQAVLAEAPVITDHLCEECADHFAELQEGLTAEEVPFTLDTRLVRGLDYYTRTAFEFVSAALPQAQGTICGGGRYDGLAEQLGGKRTPGIGFGLGMERTLLAIENEGLAATRGDTPACFVVTVGKEAPGIARGLLRTLRREGVSALSAFEPRPMKAQMKMAARSQARFAAIIGDREAAERVVTMRDLGDGEQTEVPLWEAGAWLAKRT